MDPAYSRLHLCFYILIIFLLCGLLASATRTASCHPSQRSALLQLKEGFFNSNLTSWLPNTDCCSSWDGVTCDESTGYVKSLFLSNLNIEGNLNVAISNLTSLEHLELSSNKLSGTIPNSIFKLFNLTWLHLGSNQFSGPIPNSLFKLFNLTWLDLCLNQFSGPIPNSIFKLFNLVTLNLSSNKFSGPIPNSIFRLFNLGSLHLDSNNFNGTFELSSLQNLPNLVELYLSHNQLSLEDVTDKQLQLPFPKISFFGLASCNLSQIPHLLRYHDDLEYVDLSSNNLQGVVPNWLLKRISNDQTNLNQSEFREYYCPMKIFSPTSLLNLSRNMFSSVEYGSPLEKLFEIIDFSFNKIKGPLPLIAANILDYSNNEFSEIPANYTLYLINTFSLRLSSNRLIGQIPSSICEVPCLTFLDISGNNLGGLIPHCILRAPLVFLNLASNKFHGIVPYNISKSCELVVLDLSNNNLDGNLPRSLTRCKSLALFDIRNNRITGTFPLWLGEISNLQIIILRSNRLYGTLEFSPILSRNETFFQNLRIIDLASNNFSGSLPSLWFQNLKSMTNLSSNDLTTKKFSETLSVMIQYFGVYGTLVTIAITDKGIQMSLEKDAASLMVEIDLSDNKFTGDIPETFGEILALNALNLSHNELTGSIPAAFKDLTRIESLDLSWNNLSGDIPEELTSIDSLSKLNLSFNHLVGKIPQSPHFSTFDNSSFKGNPELCGLPLSKQCKDVSPKTNSITLDPTPAKKMNTVVALCLFIGLGFGTGFAIIILWPVIKREIKALTSR